MSQKKEYEINIMFLLKALLHHVWIIVLAGVIFASGFFVYSSFFVAPTYASTAKMYVNNTSNTSTNNGNITNAEIEAAKKLVDTYIAILETPDTINLVIEESGVKYNYKQILRMISAGAVNDTQVFYVTVAAPSPEEAEKIVNAIADVLPERIGKILEGSKAKVVQYGILPTGKHSPDVTKYTAIGAVIGLLLACAVIIILELIDNTIHDENYATESYGVRTLATIPDLKDTTADAATGSHKTRKRCIFNRNPSLEYLYGEEKAVLCDKLPFRAAEAYKMLRTSIFNVFESNKGCIVVGITSPNPRDGKSTLAINLAYTLAQADKSVLLIDADMRKPVISKRLGLTPTTGLSEFLEGKAELSMEPSGYFERWHVLTSGKGHDNASELLGSDKMSALVVELRKKYDIIIIDLPPVNEVTDSLAVSSCLDGMVLAIRQNSTTKMDLDATMNHMAYSKTALMGFVVTSANLGGGKYGKYGKYGRYGRYGRYYKYGRYYSDNES